jgi:hypothetical protein
MGGQADNFYDTQLALDLVQGLGFKAILNSMLFLYLFHLVLVLLDCMIGGAKFPVVKTEVSDYVWITVWHINCWTSCWRPFFFACLQEMLCIVCKPYVAYSCFQG